MIEGRKVSWLYLLEELFILQNIAYLKVIRYIVFTFDFGQKDDKEFFQISNVRHFTVTSAGTFGELCVPLKKSWLHPWSGVTKTRAELFEAGLR